MNPAITELVTHGFYLILMLSLPPIAVASIIGVSLALFQAITQLQEQTLTFGVKLIAVSITLLLTAEWFSGEIAHYGQEIFNYFYTL
ncbi:MAG: type III secretion system export apparatus subunit SctS [Succinivibrionaceae bacterium]|nr:type III secretion system export apparatus subunit SctS [Succinivibrionaceae bacterium]